MTTDPTAKARPTDERLGKTHCPICCEPLNAKSADNINGALCSTLACQHIVHQKCWTLQSEGYLNEIARAGKGSREMTQRLRCPLCNVWNGPAGSEGTGKEIIYSDRKGGHSTWKRPSAWWSQPVEHLMHQVLGYCFQQQMWATQKLEGSVAEEQVFVRKCKNRMIKARGGQQVADQLVAAINKLSADFPSCDALVPGEVLDPVVDLLTDSLLLHVVDSKKGKCMQPGEANAWLSYYEMWLITAGLTKEEIADSKVRWFGRHTELKR